MRPFKSLSGFEGIDTSSETRMAVNQVLRRCGPGLGAAFNKHNGCIMFFLGDMSVGVGRPVTIEFVKDNYDAVCSELNLRKAKRRDKDAWAKQADDRRKQEGEESLGKTVEEANRNAGDFLRYRKDKREMGRHYKRSVTV